MNIVHERWAEGESEYKIGKDFWGRPDEGGLECKAK